MSALDRFEAKLDGLRSWVRDARPRGGFPQEQPMGEDELRGIEEEYGVSLPPEYRAFLKRFGDGHAGPGNMLSRLRAGLTPASRLQFPLEEPFLGRCSPAHQRLAESAQWEDYGELLKRWEAIPKDQGVMAISDYGCSMYGRLILAGPFQDKIWMLSGDAAYYGPFGGSEALHDESAPNEWEPTELPREYSFFEWYESWLDGQLKMARLSGSRNFPITIPRRSASVTRCCNSDAAPKRKPTFAK